MYQVRPAISGLWSIRYLMPVSLSHLRTETILSLGQEYLESDVEDFLLLDNHWMDTVSVCLWLLLTVHPYFWVPCSFDMIIHTSGHRGHWLAQKLFNCKTLDWFIIYCFFFQLSLIIFFYSKKPLKCWKFRTISIFILIIQI